MRDDCIICLATSQPNLLILCPASVLFDPFCTPVQRPWETLRHDNPGGMGLRNKGLNLQGKFGKPVAHTNYTQPLTRVVDPFALFRPAILLHSWVV